MRWPVIACLLFSVGCASPTAPTPIAPVVPTPPIVAVVPVAPPVATVDPILSDPRYSASFYRMFALGANDGGPFGLRRQTQAPRIYLRTVDDAGRSMDARTLDATAAALINTTGKLTGVFGLAGIEQGTGTRERQTGWITVRWAAVADGNVCGRAAIAGDLITLYPKTPGCGCGNLSMRPRTVKHELGHALGFQHTDSPDDLMFIPSAACDKEPSPREVFHAQVAYSRPVGSMEPR